MGLSKRIDLGPKRLTITRTASDPTKVSIAQRRNFILGRILLILAGGDESQLDTGPQLRELIDNLRHIDPVAAELADLAWEISAKTGWVAIKNPDGSEQSHRDKLEQFK